MGKKSVESVELGLWTCCAGHLDLRLERNLGWNEGGQGRVHGDISGGARDGERLWTGQVLVIDISVLHLLLESTPTQGSLSSCSEKESKSYDWYKLA